MDIRKQIAANAIMEAIRTGPFPLGELGLKPPPLPRLLTANKVMHAPGELARAQRTSDKLAALHKDAYVGGIVITESDSVQPGFIVLMHDGGIVGIISPDADTPIDENWND
jgi:hypothetical protein